MQAGKQNAPPHTPVDSDGYANIEEWLNNTDPTKSIDFIKSENKINTVTESGMK